MVVEAEWDMAVTYGRVLRRRGFRVVSASSCVAGLLVLETEPVDLVVTEIELPAGVAPIRPLLPTLTFVRNPARWGAVFRFGVVRIPDVDFARVAHAMGRNPASDFPRDAAGDAPVA